MKLDPKLPPPQNAMNQKAKLEKQIAKLRTESSWIATTQEVADFFGKSPRTIREWRTGGMPALPDGMFDLSRCVQWHLSNGPGRTEAFRAAIIERQIYGEEGKPIA